ncbi:hypothetical protein FOZ63_026830 [Perkinsus olseni]|uniref:Uncharacterized protein n=1 Tax=Perkinsus olseni TaxID=32597 RepID=A0A7J6ULG9_PEROL|nr:hypothetical protein FOZ63_026830 [Perkinsus olseni]
MGRINTSYILTSERTPKVKCSDRGMMLAGYFGGSIIDATEVGQATFGDSGGHHPIHTEGDLATASDWDGAVWDPMSGESGEMAGQQGVASESPSTEEWFDDQHKTLRVPNRTVENSHRRATTHRRDSSLADGTTSRRTGVGEAWIDHEGLPSVGSADSAVKRPADADSRRMPKKCKTGLDYEDCGAEDVASTLDDTPWGHVPESAGRPTKPPRESAEQQPLTEHWWQDWVDDWLG